MGRIVGNVEVYKNHITCSVVRLILKHMNPKAEVDLVESLVDYIMEETQAAFEMGMEQGKEGRV